MTEKILKNIKRHKGAYIALVLGLSYIGYVGYSFNKIEQQHEETKELLLKQQEQINTINKDIEEMHNRVQEISKEVELQKSIIDKTTGRLTKKSIPSGHITANRSVRQNPYTFMVKSPSTVTAYQLNKALENTGLEGLGEAFVRAELNTGINAVFLASLAVHESGWGESYLANAHNNLFGFGAYDSDPSSAVVFNSKTECIETVAEFLDKNYCNPNGDYYVNGTIAGINSVYASDDNWKNKVFGTMVTLERKAFD